MTIPRARCRNADPNQIRYTLLSLRAPDGSDRASVFRLIEESGYLNLYFPPFPIKVGPYWFSIRATFSGQQVIKAFVVHIVK